MKKILFVAASAMLLAAGCQKTEVLNQPKGNPITLSAGLNKLTKAAAADGKTNLETQGFKVWAFAAYTDALNGVEAGEIYDEMDGIDFTYTQSNGGQCSTDGVYYWPGKDRDLDFFAFSSSDNQIDPTFDGEGESSLNRKMTIADYVVNHNEPGDDLMVSKFVRTRQNPADSAATKGTVNLFFQHALSKTIFNVYTTPITGTTVTVDTLSVAGVKTKGTLNVMDDTSKKPDINGVNDVKIEWVDSTLTSPQMFRVMPNLPLTADKKPIATWLVLPQDIQNLNVEVAYTITTNNVSKVFKHTFALSNTTVTEWGRNMVTTYNINISPNVIKFTADVETWQNNPEINHGN